MSQSPIHVHDRDRAADRPVPTSGTARAGDAGDPVVSVCIPIYNGARYLDECLSSIVSQDFEDFEILVVDDCSSDDSMDIVERWAAGDRRIRIHRNERNLGLVGNWNHSIRLARGRWIKFLFQDDVMERDCLRTLLSAAKDGDVLVACARRLLFEGSIPEDVLSFYASHAGVLHDLYAARPRLSADDFCSAKLDHLNLNIVGEPSVTLVARSAFAEVGWFDPKLIQLCDSEMWNRLASNHGIVYVNRELVRFRVHGNAVSAQNFKGAFRDVLDNLRELLDLRDVPIYARFRRHAEVSGRWSAVTSRIKLLLYSAFAIEDDLRRRGVDRVADLDTLRELSRRAGGWWRWRLQFALHKARKSLRSERT